MAQAMEFGIFHEFSSREGQTDAETFDESLELVDAAEQWGLDAVWLAELHFQPARSVISAPLAVAGAIAARTQRLKIGIAVQVLPLANPISLAEEVATVDQLSRGRLIFGIGRSGFLETYDGFGVPYGESRERFAESLEILLKAWTEPGFSHEGKFHRYRNVTVVPRPYQQPYPELRVAATSSDTFPAIGAQGYPLFAAVRWGAFSDLLPDLQAYRAAFNAAGHAGEGQVFLRVPMYVAPTMAEAIAEPEPSMMAFYRGMAARAERETKREDGVTIQGRTAYGQRLQAITFADVCREKAVVGTPDLVAERLADLQAELGLNGILAELNFGGKIPRERVLRSLQLLCQEVMPRFRDYTPDQMGGATDTR